ncbi:MAG: hypothetical protein HY322_18615 [Betaproteobacteria bacterium]|nr:hypothetical protein [Betaproteobacteria bacterium]
MPDAKEIALWKARYATYSDEQLIEVKHQWIENAEQHVAAVQLLHERETEAKARAEVRAEEGLSISRKALANSDDALSVSRMALRNSTWARWIATIAILVAIIVNHSQISAFIIQWFSR